VILVVDNYDSFTYNLVQYLAEMGEDVVVRRNDAIDVSAVREMDPEVILLSPGPGSPERAGVTPIVVRELQTEVPILGICLGHQAIGQAFGGRIVRAGRIVHGKTSRILHDGRGVFEGLPQGLQATRYHSLVVASDAVPSCLEVTARSDDGEIMGLRHRELPIEGVQFHPESILTEHGHDMLRSFLRHARKAQAA
jgi:para-aminobenzoate synthetase component 2